MSVLGKWRIVDTQDYTDDYPDMMEPAHIQVQDHVSGKCTYGCVTGHSFGGGHTAHSVTRRQTSSTAC